MRVSGSLVCHVALDSLWMVHWEDRRTVKTGSHTGGNCYVVWLQCFRDIGKKCVLDLNAGETYTPVQSPESGMETVARMPFFSHCQVAVVPYDMVAQVRGCTRMRGCAGNGHSPGETQDARELGVPPGER